MTSPEFELLSGKALEDANAVYSAIAFQASDPERDLTYGLRSSEGELVALGRIQRHADEALEIGGFWVREQQRRRGIARRLVAHVLAALPHDTLAWCVPFEHLADFYASFGMERVDDLTQAPASLRAKLDFCASRKSEGVYQRTLLLRIDPKAHTGPGDVRDVRESPEPDAEASDPGEVHRGVNCIRGRAPDLLTDTVSQLVLRDARPGAQVFSNDGIPGRIR